MPLTDTFLRVPITRVKVRRDDRQRRAVYDEKGIFLDSDGLLDSIRTRGVINPIIIDADYNLVAGERRLEASRCVDLPNIPVRFLEDLDPVESKMIELEENMKRSELPWRDEVRAVSELHSLYKLRNPSHTIDNTMKFLGYSQVSYALRVARELDSPKIANATSIKQAYNIICRVDDRAAAQAVNDIVDASSDIFDHIGDVAVPPGGAPREPHDLGYEEYVGEGADEVRVPPRGPEQGPILPNVPPPPSESILNLDFLVWSRTYCGPTFNLIHCDFPYGANVFGGRWSGRDAHEKYDDTKETYQGLIAGLCEALPRLMSHSAHLLFWCSADIEVQWKTLELFRVLAPSLHFAPKPLIWSKTDNVGIVSDPERVPRHIYETCLIASQEDRKLLRTVSDYYGAPTDKSHHPSTKPEPMLRYFFQAFVDEHTTLLDPTCGGGSALRAAESLGARTVLGLERSKEYFESAQGALRTFRTLRKVTGL